MTKRVHSQTYGVAGAIIAKNGKILLIQENSPDHPDHGKWNQPAGWIDIGENPIKAGEREAKEETGLDFKATSLIGIYSLSKEYMSKFTKDKTHHPIKLIFGGEIVGGKLMKPNHEISDLKWFAPEEIYQMGPDKLRDKDIKQGVKDYLAGRVFPLGIICHTVMK